MVDSVLINEYLTALSRHLPSDVVDELRDGLLEEFEYLRAGGLDDSRAAHQTVTDFGDPESLVKEFVAQSPTRRAARTQLIVGPMVGLSWSFMLVADRGWTWPIPPVAWFLFAAALALSITALLSAATSRTSLRRVRLATVGILTLTVLDAAGIGVAWSMAGALGWLVTVPIAASIGRMTSSMRELPRLLVV